MTTTEHAAAIRAELKAKGWGSKAVGVRSESFSMGSAIRVLIKDGSVPIQAVTVIAEAHERISRCQITGEILGGGNRYVSVSYSSEALEQRAAPYRDAVQAALDAAKADTSLQRFHHDIGATGFTLAKDGTGACVDLYSPERHEGNYFWSDVRGLSARIAFALSGDR